MTTDEEMKPEAGDIVEYGVAVRGALGGLLMAAPRGTVLKVHKDGSIMVKPDNGAPQQKLQPLEFCVLSKAG